MYITKVKDVKYFIHIFTEDDKDDKDILSAYESKKYIIFVYAASLIIGIVSSLNR